MTGKNPEYKSKLFPMLMEQDGECGNDVVAEKSKMKFHHPGLTMLKMMMRHNGVSVNEFAEKVGITAKETQNIIDGQQPITENIAKGAAEVFDLSSHALFLKLQWQYDNQKSWRDNH